MIDYINICYVRRYNPPQAGRHCQKF